MKPIVIAGLGLIGGSIGKALTRAGWDVAFVDPAVSEAEGKRSGAARRRLALIDETVEGVIILATPIDTALAILDSLPEGASIRLTSACSLMTPLRSAADRRNLDLVAGHPFAGSHHAGLAAADATLFRERRWFLEKSDLMIEEIVAACGATPVVMSAPEHDRTLALTSHLPQLLSTALAGLIDRAKIDLETFGGSGLRTFLRLAASERSIWQPIFEQNREQLEIALDDLEPLLESLLSGEGEEIFIRANEVARKLGTGER